MNTLPNELVLLIFDNLSIPDKRIFIRTCKTYNNITKQSMNKIKYVIFKSTNADGNFMRHDFWCICDTLIDFRMRLAEYLVVQNIEKYYVIFKKSSPRLRTWIRLHEFTIEETIVNTVPHF